MYNKRVIFWSACAGMLLFGIAMITLGSVVPDLRAKLGLDEISAGTLFSILPIGILVGSLLFGPIVDRKGYKILITSSCIILSVGFEGVAFSGSQGILRLFVFLVGMGGGAINGATNALVSDISEKEKGANLSLLGVFFGIGALGMPLITGLLKNILSSEIIIASIGCLSLATGVFFLFIKFPAPKQQQGFPLTHGIRLFKDSFLILVSIFLFFQSSFEGIINNWTTTFIIDRFSVHTDKALFALTFFVAGMAVMRIITGGFMRSVSEKSLFTACFILILSGLIIITTGKTYSLSVTGLFILGAGLSYGFPIMLGFLGSRFADLSGTAFSIALVIALVGNMSVNYAMGFIAKIYGIRHLTTVAFAELLIMIMLATAIFMKLKDHKQ